MKIEADLMVALRSGCALGRMVESEVVAIVEHLEKLGWTAPVAPAPAPTVASVTAQAATLPSAPLPPAPVPAS